MKEDGSIGSNSDSPGAGALAPIVLFCYNRPVHLKRTLESLRANRLSSSSVLYVFADGPGADASGAELARIHETRKVVRSAKWCGTVHVFERPENFGLARSIREGVTEVVRKHGMVIVLEDDLETSPHFLCFMNDALMRYAGEARVWHISGWTFPRRGFRRCGAHFFRAMNCWGWATWRDRWDHYNNDAEELLREFSEDDIDRFNLDGAHNFWSQVERNSRGEIHTWAIFWYATIFRKGGLCLNPDRTFVRNIGRDGSGVHCGNQGKIRDGGLSRAPVRVFPKVVVEDKGYLASARCYYFRRRKRSRKTFAKRIADRFKGSRTWRQRFIRSLRRRFAGGARD